MILLNLILFFLYSLPHTCNVVRDENYIVSIPLRVFIISINFSLLFISLFLSRSNDVSEFHILYHHNQFYLTNLDTPR